MLDSIGLFTSCLPVQPGERIRESFPSEFSSSPLSWLFATGDDATVEERYANPYTLCVRVSHLGKKDLPFSLFTSPPVTTFPRLDNTGKSVYKDAEKVNNIGI